MSPEKKKTTTAAKQKTKATPKKTTTAKKPKTNPEVKQKLFEPKIEKVTINIGVGEAGERLKKAESVIQNITGCKPVETLSKTTNKDWAIRKRMPIGCKVTLRGGIADKFLKEALETRENKMADYSFDDEGNLSFGIPDHTLFKSQKYDPNVGIMGTLVSTTFSGLAVLCPTTIAALYWKKATKHGCISSIIVGEISIFLFQYNLIPNYGFLSAIWGILIAIVTLVFVSYVTNLKK